MSIYDFLERLEADPFAPELTALFLGKPQKPQKAETEPAERPEE